MGTAMNKERTIKALNELLRGELAAVDTYDQALPLLHEDPAAAADLKECRSSHHDRVFLLRNAVIQAGGEPDDSSGAWGVFAKTVESTSKALGPKMAVKTLEEGENHGMKDYEKLLPEMDASARALISTEAFPQQKRTQSIVSTLRRTMGS